MENRLLPSIRPVRAVRRTAGPDEIRGSTPNHAAELFRSLLHTGSADPGPTCHAITSSSALANRRREWGAVVRELTGRNCSSCFFLLITSLFDRRDPLFAPPCLFQERRAQRTARLARQGHRRRRPGLAGASTVLSCRWSGSAVPMAHSWLPHAVVGSAVPGGWR